MRNITMIVERVLSNSENARNSDKELIIEVLEQLGMDFTERELHIIRSVNFESIRRMRQKLNEQGKYLPRPEVARQRRLKSMIVQQNAPQAKPEYLNKLVDDQPKAISWLND